MSDQPPQSNVPAGPMDRSLNRSSGLTRAGEEADHAIEEARSDRGSWRAVFFPSKKQQELDEHEQKLIRIRLEGEEEALRVMADAKVEALRERCVHALHRDRVQLSEATAVFVMDTYGRLEKRLLEFLSDVYHAVDGRVKKAQAENGQGGRLSQRLAEMRSQRLDAADKLVKQLAGNFRRVVDAHVEQ